MTFEKENIDTLDSKGELMITIMSSLAQEESRSISENVTWGWRKRIADGKVSITYGNSLAMSAERTELRSLMRHRLESCGRSMGCFWTDRSRRALQPH